MDPVAKISNCASSPPIFSATRHLNFFGGSSRNISKIGSPTTHADFERTSRAQSGKIMSLEKEIGAPFTLASLPQSINSNSGRSRAASVHSLSGTKKRKRTEIAVGLVGEGIFIYSVGAVDWFFGID